MPPPDTSQSDNNAASGSRRFNPRRNYPSKHKEGTQHNLHPIFDWKDGVVPGTQLNYLRRAIDVNEALKQATGPFGFDLEWKPNFIKGQAESPIAVLQLAKEDQIYLIQLSAMYGFPERLQEVLEDPNIVKAGVGIMGDAKKLWRDYGVSLLGAVELTHLARSADPLRWRTGKSHELISLTRLLEAYRSRRLCKGKERMSNWELPLTVQQMNYAASDALAGYLVYQHLTSLGPNEIDASDFIAGKKRPVAKRQPQASKDDHIQSGVAVVVASPTPTSPGVRPSFGA